MRKNAKQNILISAAAKGGFWTQLSFFIMGTGCIRYKQYVRGLFYLLTQIGFFCFLKNFALQYLSKFSTLGAETQRKVWNGDLQIYQRFPGDNSMPMLTLALFTLLPIIFMILIAFTNFDADHQPPGNLFTWVGMTNVTDIFLGNEIKTNTFFGLLGWMVLFIDKTRETSAKQDRTTKQAALSLSWGPPVLCI